MTLAERIENHKLRMQKKAGEHGTIQVHFPPSSILPMCELLRIDPEHQTVRQLGMAILKS